VNQNVLNNSWFKSIGSEVASADRSQNTMKSKSTGQSSFQNYLNSQMNRAEMTERTRQTEYTPKDVKVKKEGVKSILKTVDTTASKLAVKTPEKTVEQPVEKIGTQKVAERDTTSEPVNAKLSETETQENVAAPSETSETEVKVSPENLVNMIQQLLSQIEAITTAEEGNQNLDTMKVQLEELVNQLTQIQAGGNKQIDPQLLQKVQKTVEGIMNLDNTFKPEVLEAAKAIINELTPQTKTESPKSQAFEKAMEIAENAESGVVKDMPKAQSQNTGSESSSNESASDEQVVKATTPSTEKNTVTDNSAKNTFAQIGKEKLDAKVQVTNESKQNTTQTTVSLSDVNAKMNSASIAFSKTEVANQTAKSTLQQNIMDQLINSPRMQIKQTEQGTMMTMKLNPEVLGNVEIKMEIVKGVLQAEINVENIIVKGAIEANLSDLKNALSDKGFQVESLNVSVGKDSQDNRGQQQQQQAERNDRNAEEVDMTSGSYGFESLVTDTQIDYRG